MKRKPTTGTRRGPEEFQTPPGAAGRETEGHEQELSPKEDAEHPVEPLQIRFLTPSTPRGLRAPNLRRYQPYNG